MMNNTNQNNEKLIITAHIANQLVGIDVSEVREILRQQKIAPIPLVPAEIAGSLNLRGRIVTVIDMHAVLGISPEGVKPSSFIVVENKADLFSLLVDSIGDVVRIDTTLTEENPPNLSTNWQRISAGIQKLDGNLLLLLNLKELLSFTESHAA